MYREALHHFGLIHDQEMDMDNKAEVEKILEVDLAHRVNLILECCEVKISKSLSM